MPRPRIPGYGVAMLASLLAALCVSQLAAPNPTVPPPDADGRVRLLVLDLAAEGGVDPSLVRTVAALVSADLATYRDLNVIAGADVKAMMELEGEKQQVGCGESSCLAELAGALGARLVVFGSVGVLGPKSVLHLNLFDSQTGQSVGRQFVEVDNPGELSRVLPGRLRLLLERFYVESGLVLPPAPPEAPAPLAAAPDRGPLPLILLGGGVVGVIGGAAALIAGVSPLLAYQEHLVAFNSAKGDGNVVAAGAARDDATIAGDNWNSWGVPLVIGGSVIAVAGLAAGAVGVAGLISE